jgi:hypothetical protein
MRGTRPIVVAVAISAAVAGCGGGSSSSSTKQSTTSTVGASSHALLPGELGTYVRSIPAGGVVEYESSVFTLNADGRYTETIAGFRPNGIRGVWSFRDGRITFTETGGSDASCVGQRGTYSWSYVNKTLTLSLVSDPCQLRGLGSDRAILPPWRQRS